MKHMSREFTLYQLEENELDQLVAGYNSIHLGLFGVFFGAFLTVGITWIVQANANVASLSVRATLLYFCATVIFFVATIYFGCMAVKDLRKSRRVISRIKSQSKPLD